MLPDGGLVPWPQLQLKRLQVHLGLRVVVVPPHELHLHLRDEQKEGGEM